LLNPNKKEKVLFFYNPSSGKGRIKKNLDYIEEKIKEKHGSVDIIESKSKEHLIETIGMAAKEYDYIYFSGGDGTFNMVLNALPLEYIDKPILGFIPGGSTNDMSYNLNLANDVRKGLIDCLNSKPKEYNVGMIGDKRFIYVSDFGMFTDVSHITPQKDKRKFGKLAYVYYAFKSFANHAKPYDVIIDGVKYQTQLCLISNSREVASFRINPEKRQDDGMYYIVLANSGKLHGLFNVAFLFAFGLEAALKYNKVTKLSKQVFTIDCNNHDFDVDGEYCHIDFPTKCGNSGLKINVLTNRD